MCTLLRGQIQAHKVSVNMNHREITFFHLKILYLKVTITLLYHKWDKAEARHSMLTNSWVMGSVVCYFWGADEMQAGFF